MCCIAGSSSTTSTREGRLPSLPPTSSAVGLAFPWRPGTASIGQVSTNYDPPPPQRPTSTGHHVVFCDHQRNQPVPPLRRATRACIYLTGGCLEQARDGPRERDWICGCDISTLQRSRPSLHQNAPPRCDGKGSRPIRICWRMDHARYEWLCLARRAMKHASRWPASAYDPHMAMFAKRLRRVPSLSWRLAVPRHG